MTIAGKVLDKAKDTIRELQDFLTSDQRPTSNNTPNKSTKLPGERRLNKKSVGEILQSMEDICSRHKGSVVWVLGHFCSDDPAKQLPVKLGTSFQKS